MLKLIKKNEMKFII